MSTSRDISLKQELVDLGASLSDSAMTSAMVTAVLSELTYVSDNESLDSYWLQRIFANGGIALAAANAARRAHKRLGSTWTLIDYLERFFAGLVDPGRAHAARVRIAHARAGLAPYPGIAFDDRYDEVTDRTNGAAPPVRCLGRVELLACDAVESDHIEYDVACEVMEIAHILATEVSERLAHEFVAGIESLGRP